MEEIRAVAEERGMTVSDGDLQRLDAIQLAFELLLSLVDEAPQ